MLALDENVFSNTDKGTVESWLMSLQRNLGLAVFTVSAPLFSLAVRITHPLLSKADDSCDLCSHGYNIWLQR
jgi:hypothetical protein